MKKQNKTNKYTVTAEEMLNMNIDKIPCLVEPIFQQTGVVALAGSSDTGKSTLMRQLCIAISVDEKEFLGFKINSKHNKAVYVSSEDGKYQIAPLLKKQNKGLSLPENRFKGLEYIFDTSNLLEKIKGHLEESPVDLIVIDAFADLFGKDINQANQVRNYLEDFSQLAEKHECLFIFIHHTGKSSEYKAPNKNNLLGSQGFEAKMRTVAILLNDKIDPKIRHLCFVKGNYIPENYKKESIELYFDDHMLFSTTGNRVLIEDLSKDENQRYNQQEVIRLKEEGKSQKEIATKLGISQSSVSRIINRPKEDVR